MSLNNINACRFSDEPFRVWKAKQRVHYRFDVRGAGDEENDMHKCVKNTKFLMIILIIKKYLF